MGKLIAWDPAQGKAAWTIEQKGAFNGGVLATAGNLVFQGMPDGVLVAYAADTGKVLWQAETSIGIIAPPISYRIGDEQYVAVLAGWGGNPIVGMDAAVAAAVTHVNMGRMMAWKLGGHATDAAGSAEERRHSGAAAAHRVGRHGRSRPPDLQRESAGSVTACSRCRAAW